MEIYKIFSTFLDSAHDEYHTNEFGICMDKEYAEQIASQLTHDYRKNFPNEFVKMEVRPIKTIDKISKRLCG